MSLFNLFHKKITQGFTFTKLKNEIGTMIWKTKSRRKKEEKKRKKEKKKNHNGGWLSERRCHGGSGYTVFLLLSSLFLGQT